MTDTGSLYASPMLYDILYTPGTAAEVDALERIERRYTKTSLTPNRLWFEPACGTGRYLRVAVGRGRTVAGFDNDQRQIDYARRRISGDLFQADMLNFASAFERPTQPYRRVAFAFNPVNSIRHLETDAQLVTHLNQMAQVMIPGGLYVVGLSLFDDSFVSPEEDTWQGVRGRCQVNQLVNYLPPEKGSRVEIVISHLTVTRPSGQAHHDARYQLHCCDQRQWRAVVAQSDLKWRASCDGLGLELVNFPASYQLEVLQA